MVDNLQSAFAEFIEAIKNANHAFDRFSQAFANAKEVLWQAYLESGAPYGKDDEGFIQWLEELNEGLLERDTGGSE